MDRTDFHQLYEAHARSFHRLAVYLTGRLDEADEITAETLLRAWTAKGQIRETTARSYLMAIARNLAIDRNRRRHRETEIDAAWPSVESSPDQMFEFQLTLAAIRQLPIELSEPLAMSAIDGWSYEEIAAALGTPLSTVKIRIHRAHLRLAQELDRKRSPR